MFVRKISFIYIYLHSICWSCDTLYNFSHILWGEQIVMIDHRLIELGTLNSK